MADYLPLFDPSAAVTLTASATITGGQLVEVSGNGTVGPAGAASAKWVGVAGHSAAANGRLVVWARGTLHSATASGGITAGAQVTCGAAGTVASLAAASGNAAADINAARAVIGVALTTVSDTETVKFVTI